MVEIKIPLKYIESTDYLSEELKIYEVDEGVMLSVDYEFKIGVDLSDLKRAIKILEASKEG